MLFTCRLCILKYTISSVVRVANDDAFCRCDCRNASHSSTAAVSGMQENPERSGTERNGTGTGSDHIAIINIAI